MTSDNLARHWIISFPDEKAYMSFVENTELTTKFKELKKPVVKNGIFSVEVNYGKRVWKKTIETMIDDYSGKVSLAQPKTYGNNSET